ncbi:MAG TPA: DUF4198 domain-containing protein [Thermoanaerobaculia bacterium]|nr:DUF4198 domain-containing protein [Thermoanaerobaculia bacterium]
MAGFPTRRGAAVVAAALLAAALSSPVRAHDLWLEPSSFHPAPGAEVAVRILVGHGPADGEPLTPRPEWIERFVLAGPSGATPVAALPGADPPGRARVGEAGLWAFGLESGDTLHTLSPERFAGYLAEEGLEEAAAAAREAGLAPPAAAGPVRELFARSVKALLRVGGAPPAAPGTAAGPVLGQELELLPLADPFAPEAGELPLRVLLRGEPAPGVLVEAAPLAGGEAPSRSVSDAGGVARIPLPAIEAPAGWLVSAVVLEPAPAGSDAHWRSVWSSLTFERRPR